jgi:3-isopropylmalate dehydrogenase
MLLEWLGARDAAQAIEAAVDATLRDPKSRTADLGGAMGTAAFGAAVAGKL